LQKALSSKKITSGFKKMGIWPFNPEAVRNQIAPAAGFGEGQASFDPHQLGYESRDSSDVGEEADQDAARADQGCGGVDLGAGERDHGEDDEGGDDEGSEDEGEDDKGGPD
jgi:hypothetical protein